MSYEMEKYDSNNGGYPGQVQFGRGTNDQFKPENEGEESNPAAQKAGEYVRELLQEKLSLDQNKHPNATRLVDQEINKVQAIGKAPQRDMKYVDIYRAKPIKVTVKVLVPVNEHPKFNFVGKLLGPKGNSMKRLQEESGCKMAVLGRGSMKDRQKEEELRQSLDPKYAHLTDDLHVEISALASPAEAHARVAHGLAVVRKYLIPDNNDNIRQEQMREMEIMTAADTSGEDVRGHTGRRPMRGGGGSRGMGGHMSGVPRGQMTPRVMPATAKIMSILEKARMAMEESYGYEEAYEPNEAAAYDYMPTQGHNARGRYHAAYEVEPEAEYYTEGSSAGYTETNHHRWKAYKTSGPSAAQGAPTVRHSDPNRYRTSPYTRPAKPQQPQT